MSVKSVKVVAVCSIMTSDNRDDDNKEVVAACDVVTDPARGINEVSPPL